MSTSNKIIMVSSCLVGLCTRYDGRSKTNHTCLQQLQSSIWIPFCPEQLGGLPTPREAADIIGGNGDDVLNGQARVVTKSGQDITSCFINGAQQVLTMATHQPVDAIYLKSGSPSCGLLGKQGVTAALLQQKNFKLKEF